MKKFYPTYLYIKTHNITGLKYFGKTTNDPYKYYGSGKHWISHLKKHGYNISTEVIGFFENIKECQHVAETFSIEHDITGSKEWANMIVENGLDGGDTGRTYYAPHTVESRKKMSETMKGSVPWNKGTTGLTPGNILPKSEKTKQKIREANLGKKQSPDTIEKRRLKLIGHEVTASTRKKISDGHKGKTLSEETKQKLRDRVVSVETKQKIREARSRQIFTDKTKEKLSGFVVVVDKHGKCVKITKDEYYSQHNDGDDRHYVFHNSNEGKRRKQVKCCSCVQ